MARPRYPKSSGPLPPPLVPATRTVGQLVAETLTLYGSRFFVALPLGLVVAVADQASLGLDVAGAIAVLLIASPFLSAAYAAAAALAVGKRPSARTWAVAIGAGTLVFVPAAFLFPWFAIAAIVVLALFGNAVPAAVIEELGLLAAFRRSLDGRPRRSRARSRRPGNARPHVRAEQARDGISAPPEADNTLRVAIFLADTVLGPILFLGGALLFVDLAARVGTTRAGRLAARVAEHDAAK